MLTLPRPVVGGQRDTAVNVTSLAVFAGCPRKYYLQRYIGWNTGRRRRFDAESLPEEEEDDTDLDAAELGSLVHEVLAGKEGPHPIEAQKLADVFLESDLGRRAGQATRVEREWEFIADIDDTLVRGSVDLWFEEGGEIHLVDYKTDAVARPGDYAPATGALRAGHGAGIRQTAGAGVAAFSPFRFDCRGTSERWDDWERAAIDCGASGGAGSAGI